MAIARFPTTVLDCPDPGALATFYGAMLDWKVEVSSDWADIRADYGHCISFQQVQDYTPPVWPGQEVPQQMHLDVIVDDLDVGEAAVLDLGATCTTTSPARTSGCSSTRPGTPSASAWTDPAGRRSPDPPAVRASRRTCCRRIADVISLESEILVSEIKFSYATYLGGR